MNEQTQEAENPIDAIYADVDTVTPPVQKTETDSGKVEVTAEPKADSQSKDTSKVKTPEEYEAEIDRLQCDLETSEKRVRDSQKAMHEAKVEAAKLKKNDSGKGSGEKDENWFDDEEGEKPLEDQTQKSEDAVRTEPEKNAAIEAFEEQERRFMAEHPDYGDAVTEELIQLIASGKGEMAKQWFSSDKTPETLYQLGKRFNEAQEMIRDPEGFKNRLKDEKNKQTLPETQTIDDEDEDGEWDGLNRALSKGKSAPVHSNTSFNPIDELYG